MSVAVPGKGKGRLKAGGASSDPTLNRHKGHGSSRSLPSHGEMMTDTDSESQASSKTSKSRLSVKRSVFICVCVLHVTLPTVKSCCTNAFWSLGGVSLSMMDVRPGVEPFCMDK